MTRTGRTVGWTTWTTGFRRLAAFALAFTLLLVIAPGCGGGGAYDDDFGVPPSLVGRVTGTWQGSLTGVPRPEQPTAVNWAAGPAGTATLVIARDGSTSGTLRDTASGEIVAFAGSIQNYESKYFHDPKKPAGSIAPAGPITFQGRQYTTMFVDLTLEPDGRLTGGLVLERTLIGSGGYEIKETASSTFALVKQQP